MIKLLILPIQLNMLQCVPWFVNDLPQNTHSIIVAHVLEVYVVDLRADSA